MYLYMDANDEAITTDTVFCIHDEPIHLVAG